jgi:folate-binding protein YgfZ
LDPADRRWEVVRDEERPGYLHRVDILAGQVRARCGEVMTVTGTTQLSALEEGRAFVELAGWRTVAVRGSDAPAWLHDLITADVEGLRPREARRSLLLTPTGRIRADFQVGADRDGFVLLQAPDQPDAVATILARYVLSSDVTLEDRTETTSVFAVLGGEAAEDGESFSPSILDTGHTVLVRAGDAADRLREHLLGLGLVEVSADATETWRILHGRPRMMADFGQDALPAEAGLESAIDFTKGCFLGQESVAKVRNLGHPPTILKSVRADSPLAVGDVVLTDGDPVGAVTSAAIADGAVVGLVRVRWDAAEEPLVTSTGTALLQQQE